MQRLGRHSFDDRQLAADDERGEAKGPWAGNGQTAPHDLDVSDSQYRAVNVVDASWDAWLKELQTIGGESPLIHFRDETRARIDVTSTHPGGLAQLVAGKSTLLSNLIRDELSLRAARNAAGNIVQKSMELVTARSIDAVHLALGIAEWKYRGRSFRAPVMLRPLMMRRVGRDFELQLAGRPRMNPAFLRAMRDQFGIELDAEAFAAIAESDGAFKAQAIVDRVRGLTSHLTNFDAHPRLVISTFAEVAQRMVADQTVRQHPVTDALAGNETAREALKNSYTEVEPVPQDDRPPVTDTLVLDADQEQEFVVAQINAGSSVVVETLPGTGGTQTIVNALGCLVSQNKSVLVVSPRAASLRGIEARLREVGLGGLAVTPRALKRGLVQSIARNEKTGRTSTADIDDALVRLRHVLLDYRDALAKEDPELGVSMLDALAELSRLALLPEPPSTTARLGRESIVALARGREQAAKTLIKAAELGQFRYGPDDSPWYGASFDSSKAATEAHELAKSLDERRLPMLLERAREVISSTHLRDFETIGELGVFLDLLADIRTTLDRFTPEVFDHSLAEVIAATGPKRDSADMTGANRRRLKKLAREYVRPGAHVDDIHSALQRVQHQRVLWHRYIEVGTTPEVPKGLDSVRTLCDQVTDELQTLDAALDHSDGMESLVEMPLEALREKIAGLAEDSEVLQNLQERTALMATLREVELAPLLTDLAARHIPEDRVSTELELAWWQSVLEDLLTRERALLNANTSVLDRLEADFRLVDEAHAAGCSGVLAWQLAEMWKIGLVDYADEASALKAILRGRRGVTSANLHAAAPKLSTTLAPVWLASPYDLPMVDRGIEFDAVFLVDAGTMSVAESLGALTRAKQTVLFGDPVTQVPAPFEIATGSGEPAPHPTETENAARERSSVLARMQDLLPTLSLTRSYRAGGEDLAELVNRRFYDGRISGTPWAGAFLGQRSLQVSYVEGGTGMPDEYSGAVESTDAEVTRVVELVIDHALHRPKESLMVITASPVHAVRVQQAVLSAVGRRQDIAPFFTEPRSEQFLVATLEQCVAQSRDRVIFSIGYGRTPHGRVLSNFGRLAQPGGDRLLAIGMTRARRALTLVSCFGPDELEQIRQAHGIGQLAEILDEAAHARRFSEEGVPSDDPMLEDLARRLEFRGMRVVIGHRGVIELAASYGNRAIVVETDQRVTGSSLRESLRLRPDLFKRFGWYYLRVHSFELFADPDEVVDRIARALRVPNARRAPGDTSGRRG